jgi:hypothetical protein
VERTTKRTALDDEMFRQLKQSLRNAVRSNSYSELGRDLARRFDKIDQQQDQLKIEIGRILVTLRDGRYASPSTFLDAEFKIFSQWGDDGLIQFLIAELTVARRIFIEFGVGNYKESNTRFLLMKDNWSGLIFDSSKKNIDQVKSAYYFWHHDLIAKDRWITVENIEAEIRQCGLAGDIGLLHIDVDGNDFWIWKKLEVITPIIVIIEYNSVFGVERSITTPYRADFDRTKAHHSNLLFGASLRGLVHLGNEKGYAFVGCNSAGNNAYFVRREFLTPNVKEVSVEAGYVESHFRESRGQDGRLTWLQGDSRLECISGSEVFDIATEKLVKL